MSIRQGTASLMEAAVGYALRGWPVFPVRPAFKVPAIPAAHPAGNPCQGECGREGHGCHDATTDVTVIARWWTRFPQANIGIATGAPGPDVLDGDIGLDGNCWAGLDKLKRAGLLTGACRMVRTRSGGVHLYYQGTAQGCGSLKRHHVDFRSAGGYVLAPPSWVAEDDKGPAGFYELVEERDASGLLDWQAVRLLLDPPRPRRNVRQPLRGDAGKRWAGVIARVSGLADGQERWKHLHWAARIGGQLGLDAAVVEADVIEAATVNGFIADKGEREALRKIRLGLRKAAQ